MALNEDKPMASVHQAIGDLGAALTATLVTIGDLGPRGTQVGSTQNEAR